MWSPRGIEPREGAELSKRDSVCQRSSQGAKAPQRSARAQRGRDSLPRHLELTRTSAKGSFSFTERPAEIASRNFGPEWDELSALRPLGKARPGIRRQNGTRFPFTALGGSCVPDPALRTGCIFRVRPRTENASHSRAEKRDTLSGACLRCPCASRRAISCSACSGHSSHFCATLQTVRSPVRTRGYTQNDTFPMQYDAGSTCAIRRGP